ncbi:MAG: PilZ domain-containing protein [Acidobacteria bacterium]|nr:PilZ domain-containing protein [Acidobacteriota bacterium]
MEPKNTKVLAAGIDRVTFEQLAPVMQRDAVEVDWVATPEEGVDLASGNRYDVIIMDAAVPADWPLELVVKSFRAKSSTSRTAAILVLAEPDQVDVARALRSRGVNRVMLATDPPEIICDQVAALLEVAPRVHVRLTTNVEAALGEAGRELFCQTVNLSSTGMLIRTRHRPTLGTPVEFKINLPEELGTICGRGDVVRHATKAHGGVEGIAIRFVDFANGGTSQLQKYLEGLTTEPDPEPELVNPRLRPSKPSVAGSSQNGGKRKRAADDIIIEYE